MYVLLDLSFLLPAILGSNC